MTDFIFQKEEVMLNKKILALLSVLFGFYAYAQDITFVSWGGAYGKAQEKHMTKPYTSYSNNRVLVSNYSGGIAELKAQVESGNVSWDVLDMEYVDVDRACDEGLLEVIDPKILANGVDGSTPQDDFIEGTLHECAVGNIIWSIIYAYNNNTIGSKNQPLSKIFLIQKNFPENVL